MDEYPKRIYIGADSYLVNSAAEEEALLHPAPVKPVAAESSAPSVADDTGEVETDDDADNESVSDEDEEVEAPRRVATRKKTAPKKRTTHTPRTVKRTKRIGKRGVEPPNKKRAVGRHKK